MTILDRWRVTSKLPAQGELQRWALEGGDGDGDGRRAEAVQAAATARLRDPAGDRARLAATAPAVSGIHTQQAVDVGGHPVRIRDRAAPLPGDLRIDGAEVLRAAAWLAPAVRDAAGALGGELTREDLVLDSTGAVQLSPSGLVRATSLHRTPAHRPAGWRPDQPAAEHAASALYGLGVLLFELATGQPPVGSVPLGELAAAQARPLDAGVARPELPGDARQLLNDLVSPDPRRRMAATTRLPPATGPWRPAAVAVEAAGSEAAGSEPVSVTARPATPPSALQPARPPAAIRDVPLPAWVVVHEPKGMTGTARTRLAALLDVPEAALEGEEPRVIGGGATEGDAHAQAEVFGRTGATVVVEPAPRGKGAAVAALLAALCAAALALILPGGWPLAALVISGALLVGAKALARRAGPPHLDAAELRRAWSRLQAATPCTFAGPDGAARAALSGARRAVLQRDLPDPIRVDLLDGLDGLADQLDELGADARAADLEAITRAAAAVVDTARAALDGPRPQGAARALEEQARVAAQALDPSRQG